MSRRKTIIVATGLLLMAGASAVVWAQGHRREWGHGPMHFGGDGMDGPGMGGMRGRFGGSLTKEEAEARARERFARLDRNSDGIADAAEIEASMTSRRQEFKAMAGGGMERQGERMIRFFDTNNDGKVTKEEMQAGVRTLFAEMDLDNDGRITDADLPPLMRGRNVLAHAGRGAPGGPGPAGGMPGMGGPMGGMPGGGMGLPMMRLLAGAEADKDGAITLDAVLAAADKRFATLDRNKDGAIDKADFDALQKEMVDYRVKRFIHHFGADKEGKVSREQFMQKASERFARMDLNNDGTISRDEMPGDGRGFGGGPGGWHRGGGERGPGPGGPGGPGGEPEAGPGGPGGSGGPRPRRGGSGPN